MLNTFLYQRGKPLEVNVSRAAMLSALADKDSVLWVDLKNPNDFEADCLVEIFNFHDMAVEDCINPHSQPKVDDYGEYLFLVMHGVSLQDKKELATLEINIFIGKNFVVTYHKDLIPAVENMLDLVKKNPETFIVRGPDMLTYHLLDELVDNYQPILDQYEEKIDALEEEIFNHPSQDFLATIMQVKRDVFHFRRIIAPQRDALNHLTRNPTALIKSKHLIYFRDVYDRLFRLYGTVEGFHDALSGILQAYFSYSSNKLNEIMKRMTVLATLTMPTVIIASIYGMNFKNMPELGHPYGYFMSLGLMVVTSMVMLVWMKFKKWI